jgi:dipeptidyl aminopeptidase/acylaminoacyl peptidase
LKQYRLAPMHAIEGKSRDGLTLVLYLTLPADVGVDRPPQPLPMVLVVHGGPWRATYSAIAAIISGWLTEATPSSRSIIAARLVSERRSAPSEKEHARKMHNDLIDMVEWAIDEGIAQKDKIAIFGPSYGGLASFVGAIHTGRFLLLCPRGWHFQSPNNA